MNLKYLEERGDNKPILYNYFTLQTANNNSSSNNHNKKKQRGKIRFYQFLVKMPCVIDNDKFCSGSMMIIMVTWTDLVLS